MEIDEAYKGREHSLVKHELLKGYLEKLLSIVGVTGKTKEIVYVDCFAGPWGDDSKSLSGASLAISLEILGKVRESLATVHKISGIRFKAIYVEELKKRHKQLSDYLAANCPEGVSCYALHGDYFEKQDEILRLCGDGGFAFFFIDPKGWKDVGIQRLAKLLRRPKSEFLITFMYDFFNRAIGMTELRQQVHEMLGELTEDDYQEISSQTGKERGELVVRKYRQQLKVAMGPDGAYPPRSYHAEVLNKEKDRVHYHLVYLTRHHKGIVKFAESSEDIEFLQRVIRIQRKRNVTGQIGLFSPEDEAANHGSPSIDLENVKNYWLTVLSDKVVAFDEARLADMLEETDWLISDFQAAFGELLGEEKVENVDAKGKRTKRYVHFDKGERLRRCV